LLKAFGIFFNLLNEMKEAPPRLFFISIERSERCSPRIFLTSEGYEPDFSNVLKELVKCDILYKILKYARLL
jgi:hypothetical protein